MKTIVLILSIVMPAHQPDIDRARKVASAEECWTEARKWSERDLSDEMKQMGALGFKATCAFVQGVDEDKPDSKGESF
jgi:hypothetical protein